ncbi:D-3-phosphoglycerate dehydrogenase [Microbacterium sp. 8M]|jgi:phosphoglycerate dehydrogenase-like enzyme|uniref:hydroxyacid dehydrogenase n=1 Tax=Microbacterium sp. 8M TaxID=2653153 RepID=UPI0012F36ED4|nr:hydroxyacid dehydrogenase [Microbacterium sp. 8M]VXB36774.1 D-3-phosphoglycerate dehydrogenase [Microbacterium sp. 8M]
MTASTTPNALVVMSREVFERQFDDARITRLRRLATVPDPVFTDDLDDPALAGRLAEVEVLLTGWGAPRLDAQRLARLPKLRAMLHCAGSIRPQVSDEFWARGIRAASVADVNAAPVAEFTLAAVIFAGKKAPFIAADPASRRLNGLQAERFGELSNFGRTIGVVGFSRVGRRVVSVLQQLDDVTVLVADPYADPDEIAAAGGVHTSLEALLPRVDVLSLHAPELPSTRHMIGAEQLAALPDHATVINTARGSLIDTAALERECGSGRLNAILDVTDPEPLPEGSPLFPLPNVMITPHLAGSLGSELFRMTDAALDELERYAAGEPLWEEVTLDALQLSA